MNNRKSKDRNKSDLKNQIIQRKNDEIESLKDRISDLQIENKEKDELINSIESLRNDLKNTIEEIKAKGKEYDTLIEDLRMMKKVMNTTVFHGKWRIIKWLMR